MIPELHSYHQTWKFVVCFSTYFHRSSVEYPDFYSVISCVSELQQFFFIVSNTVVMNERKKRNPSFLLRKTFNPISIHIIFIMHISQILSH